MILLAHDSEEDARASAEQLRQLGGHAKKLLAECVKDQELERKSLSATARALNDAGFIFVRDLSSYFEGRFVISPSLAGEEALEMLEKLEASKPTKTPRNRN